ncbi:hypothetical protein [Corynebacterium kalidii]
MNSPTASPRRFVPRAVGAFLALTVAVGLAACGDDESESGEAAGPDLTSAPQDVRWTDHSGVKAPQATSGDCAKKSTSGAGQRSSKLVSWSEQTPQCAVIAAMAGQTLLDTTGDDDWPVVASQILAPGEGKDQWAQARALMTKSGRVIEAPEFAGFRITDYSDTGATILIAVDRPDGTTDATPTQLAWQADRWQLVLPTQETAVDAVQIDSLDGFTAFGPETETNDTPEEE